MWPGRSIKRGSVNDPRNLVLASVLFFRSRCSFRFLARLPPRIEFLERSFRRYSDSWRRFRRPVTARRSDRNAESEERIERMHFRPTERRISMYDRAVRTLSRSSERNTWKLRQPRRPINAGIRAGDRGMAQLEIKLRISTSH